MLYNNAKGVEMHQTIAGEVEQRAIAYVVDDSYKQLQRKMPDLFHNPEIKIVVITREEFEEMA